MGDALPKPALAVMVAARKCAQPRTGRAPHTTARWYVGDYIRGGALAKVKWWQLSNRCSETAPEHPRTPQAIPASVPACGQPHGARSQGSTTAARTPLPSLRGRGSSPASTASRQRRDLWIVGLWLSIPQVSRGEARFGIRPSDVTVLGYAPLDLGMPQSRHHGGFCGGPEVKEAREGNRMVPRPRAVPEA